MSRVSRAALQAGPQHDPAADLRGHGSLRAASSPAAGQLSSKLERVQGYGHHLLTLLAVISDCQETLGDRKNIHGGVQVKTWVCNCSNKVWLFLSWIYKRELINFIGRDTVTFI